MGARHLPRLWERFVVLLAAATGTAFGVAAYRDALRLRRATTVRTRGATA